MNNGVITDADAIAQWFTLRGKLTTLSPEGFGDVGSGIEQFWSE